MWTHPLVDEAAEPGEDEVEVFAEEGVCRGGGVLHSRPMSRDKRLQDRSIYPHWCTDTVRFSDQDAAGHINNVALCAYLETARLTFIRDVGMMSGGEDGVRGISAGMNVSFLAESHWPGQVELGTGVIAIGTSSVTVGSAAFKDGACIVAAEMTVVRLKGKTPHPIGPDLRSSLEKYRLKGFQAA